jgi:hypothetical protein
MSKQLGPAGLFTVSRKAVGHVEKETGQKLIVVVCFGVDFCRVLVLGCS